MDQKFRSVERSGDPAGLLRERLRAGHLTRGHLQLAARLGHAAARALLPTVDLVEWTDQGSCMGAIEAAAALVGPTLPARVACEWAERSLGSWEERYPDDRRPHEALAAARAWVACPCKEHLEAAAEAGFAADDAAMDAMAACADHTQRPSPTTYEDKVALAAADSSQAEATSAGFAAHATWTEPRAAAFDAAVSGTAAVTNAKDPEAERTWQRLRLADLVLGLADEPKPG